jgi:invasion protein IalB
MNSLQSMVLAALMMAAVGSGAAAQEAQPPADAPPVKPEKFKDWDLFCLEPKTANAPRVCEIRTVIASDKGQRLGVLVVATVDEPGDEAGQMIASALVPLGVDLTAEPTLAVGADQPSR